MQNPGFAQTAARKPRLVAAVLRHRVLKRRRSSQGLQTPSCLEYAVTYACQAKCSHCSASTLESVDRERGRLDRDAVKRLARQARALGIYEVNFTGGEPTLRKDLEEVVDCFAPRRTFIGVNTNGQLLDAERVRSLRDAGVDLLKLSLDSPDPKEHDENRRATMPMSWTCWICCERPPGCGATSARWRRPRPFAATGPRS